MDTRRGTHIKMWLSVAATILMVNAIHGLANPSGDEGVTFVTKQSELRMTPRRAGAFEMISPHKGGAFKGKEEECKSLPIKINKTCYMDIEREETYTCMKPKEEQVCEDKPFVIDSICRRPSKKNEPYECSKVQTRKQCAREPVTVPETCYRKVRKQEPYECRETKNKETCSDVVEDVPAVCTRTVQKPYDCSKSVEVCEDKPAKKLCKHTTMQRQPYTCSKTTHEEVCDDVYEEDKSCGTTIVEEIPYDCSETVIEEDCSKSAMVSVPSKVTASRKHAYKQPVDTKYSRHRQAKKNIQKPSKLQGPAAAPMKATRRHAMQHKRKTVDKQKVSSKGVPVCKGKECNVVHLHHKGGPMPRALTALREHRVVNAQGTRAYNARQKRRAAAAVARSKAYSKSKSHSTKLTTKVTKATTKAVMIAPTKTKAKKAKTNRAAVHSQRVKKARGVGNHAAKCKKTKVVVNKTCYKKVEKTLNGKCPKHHKGHKHCKQVPVTVQDICYKDVPVHEERVCGKEKERKCYTKQMPETCHRAEPETYDCSKQEVRRKCTTSQMEVPKTCYKTVSAREAYDCSKTSYVKKCEDVEEVVADTCYRTVSSLEEYKCSKTDTKKHCRTEYINSPATCQKKVIVQEPYDCSITEIRTHCGKPRGHQYLHGASVASGKTAVFEKLYSGDSSVSSHFQFNPAGHHHGMSMNALKDLVKKNGGQLMPHLSTGEPHFTHLAAPIQHGLLVKDEKKHVLGG